MKIGIVTFWNSEDNYGQILQCYALQRFLRDKGHDAFLIRYAPGRKINLKWVLSLPCRIVRKISLRLFRRKEFRFSQRFKEMNRIVRQENAAIRVIFRHSKSALLRSLRESMINMIFSPIRPGRMHTSPEAIRSGDRSIRSIT